MDGGFMHLYKASCALIMAAILLVGPAYADLQVHLTFDENVGAVAFNSGVAGDVNDATFNTDAIRVPGIIGGAVDYNEFVQTSSNPTVGDTLRTISFWVNTTQATGLTQYMTFGSNQTGGKFDIGIDAANGGHLEVGVGFGRMDSNAATITTTPLNDGNWHLATVVIPDMLDGDSGVTDIDDIDIYVDGIFSYDGSANNAPGVVVNTTATGLALLNGAGSTDDIAIWDTPLTPDEIKGHFDVGLQLGVNAGIYDQVLTLHDAGFGTIYAGDFAWTYASGLSSSAGITGSNLVLDDAANTGISFSTLIPGDVNRNGVADLDDFSVIRTNFLDAVASRDNGDLTGDGVVDFTDFRVWSDASGNTVSFAQLFATSVPEPSSIFLLAGFGAAFALRRRRACVMAVAGLAIAVSSVQEVSAQTTNVYFDTPSGNYDSDGSWDSGFRPEDGLDERAVIGSNSTDAMLVGAEEDATATLNSSALSPSGLFLGDGAGSVGRLEIGTAGSLSVPGTTTDTTGIRLGAGDIGRGFISIEGNGSLTGRNLNLNGRTDGLEESEWSAITLTDNASLSTTVGNLQVNRVLNVTGPNVTIDTVAEFGLGNRGRYYANITGSTHSIISSTSNLLLDGAVLIPDFSGTASAVEGASWDLFDSSAVVGAFSEIRVPGRVPGQGYVIESRDGGTNGVITSLAIRSTLVLEVNRDTGMVEMTQPFGTAVNIDGYSIESASGNLGSGTWTSLDSQSIADWTEANSTSTALNELKPTTSTTIAGAGFSLGQAYTPDFSTFGQTVDEDLVFEYFDTTTNQVVQGEVIYSGTKVNDLVLIVDPSTGQAQLRNTSNASLSLDGYKISSASGALTTGGWSSLEGQASADWFEAEESSMTLAELLPEGTEILGANQGYNLGSLFSTSGEQDLIIEYLQDGANVLQEGQVLYDLLPAFPAGLAGDFNNDGTVDAADYTVYRDNLGLSDAALNGNGTGDVSGTVVPSDYTLWVASYGNSSSTSSAASVPEASTGVLAMLAMFIGGVLRRSRASLAPLKVKPALKVAAACLTLTVIASSSSAQVTLFDHNFDNAPNPGTAVTSVSDLGTPSAGSFSFSGSPVGGIGGGSNPALAVANSSNGITNLTSSVENSVSYSGTFPETMVADAGSGDLVYLDFDSAGPITSVTTETNISFNMNLFGTSNSGAFKYNFIRGLDASDNEVFELLSISGSGGGTREWYARAAGDDETTLTAANAGTPDGALLAENFSALLSTNVANGKPANSVTVDISLSSGMVTYDISATDGSGTATALNGTALAINSAATTISRLEFGSIWNASVNAQNKGFWIDDVFASTSPIGSFPVGDVNFDGNVDTLDFDIIAANFKSSASSLAQGDINDDGFVDFADFKLWKDASTASSSTALTIPEPSAVILAILAMAGVVRGRCR